MAISPINPSGRQEKYLFQMTCSELNPHPKWYIVLRLKRLGFMDAKTFFSIPHQRKQQEESSIAGFLISNALDIKGLKF